LGLRHLHSRQVRDDAGETLGEGVVDLARQALALVEESCLATATTSLLDEPHILECQGRLGADGQVSAHDAPGEAAPLSERCRQ